MDLLIKLITICFCIYLGGIILRFIFTVLFFIIFLIGAILEKLKK